MDPSLTHLAAHHFPVVLALAGATAFLAGLVSRRAPAQQYGALSLLLAGAAAPAAYLSGRWAGAEVASRTAGVAARATLGSVLEAHALYGLLATLTLIAAGVTAGVWLRRPGRRLGLALAALAVLAALLSAAAGRKGGYILHGGPSRAAAGRLERGLEDLDRRDVLLGIRPEVGEDVVQLDHHPEQLLVKPFIHEQLSDQAFPGQQAGHERV